MSVSKFYKSNIFATIALILVLIFFTIPMVVFYKVPDKIKSGDTASIPSYVYPLWNIYQTGRYVSPYAPKGYSRDLRAMIEKHAEIGAMSAPIWFVSLEAPNYPKDAFPKGIPVYFHLDGYSGDVSEMNTINHFIGMYPMEAGAQTERALAPYIMLFLALLFIGFIFYRGKFSNLLLIIPVIFPVGFFVFYSGWLYWYGHNLQDWGMFKIKPFMPTALGDGKVAQFTTHSYPSIGFYILVIIAILSFLAILSRRKETKNSGKN